MVISHEKDLNKIQCRIDVNAMSRDNADNNKEALYFKIIISVLLNLLFI